MKLVRCDQQTLSVIELALSRTQEQGEKPPARGGFVITVRRPERYGVTAKLLLLVSVPTGVVMAISPVTAPVGTTAVTRVFESTVKVVAFTPPKLTAVV